MFSKKKRNKYSDLMIDINDVKGTKTYERFFIDPNDKIFIHDGKYHIKEECIQILYGYDPKMEILHGFKKIKRYFQHKKIGVLNFNLSSYEDENCFPITRKEVSSKNYLTTNVKDDSKATNPKTKEMFVTDSPLLLKSIILNDQFAKFIRSLPVKKKGAVNFNSKWIIVILGVVGIVVVLGILFGFIKF